MDAGTLIAIGIAAAVAAVCLMRASAATKAAADAKSELAEVKAALEAAEARVKSLLATSPEPEPVSELPPASDSQPASEQPASEAQPAPAPGPDAEVVKRADEMLQAARIFGQHVGFDAQIEVGGTTGTRVPVEVDSELDEEAFAHLSESSDAILEAGEKNGGHYVVLRG